MLKYCQFISRSTARDPCYFEFIIGFDQLSLCDKIETNYFISSCKSLKIIKETQESIDNQEEQIGDYSFVSAVRTAVNEGKSSQEILAMLGEDNPDINDYNMMDQVIIAVNEGKSDEEIALIILS